MTFSPTSWIAWPWGTHHRFHEWQQKLHASTQCDVDLVLKHTFGQVNTLWQGEQGDLAEVNPYWRFFSQSASVYARIAHWTKCHQWKRSPTLRHISHCLTSNEPGRTPQRWERVESLQTVAEFETKGMFVNKRLTIVNNVLGWDIYMEISPTVVTTNPENHTLSILATSTIAWMLCSRLFCCVSLQQSYDTIAC